GVIGGAVGALLVGLFSRVMSFIIIFLVLFVFIMIVTHTELSQLYEKAATPVRNVSAKAAERLQDSDSLYNELKKLRRRFNVDVPVDGYEEGYDYDAYDDGFSAPPVDLAPPEQTFDDIKNEMIREISEDERPAIAEQTSDDVERLIKKASAPQTKRQRIEEINREAIDFAREVKADTTRPEAYTYPPISLLLNQDSTDDGDIKSELRLNAKRLIDTLDEYGVTATVSDISRGPAVTRYELQPAPGVKISKITSLTNDIALRLAAKAIRIEAPIPGKPALGVEIPNKNMSIVRVRELIGSDQFRMAQSPVTVSIGKDIEGNIVLADLAKMPHLLIAGSTGMGKSVCINSMLISLLYKSTPEDVRLIMVDPKSVELDIYNGIPHLLVPVVCDPKKAAGALQWAVSEMDKRYALLKQHSVRNIDGYNKLAEKNPEMQKMPRIVIIIDEMADLMSTSPKEVENAIARLAAMARAAGMHMVLATQRPSVDVITGTIKNNIPSRIAFAVSSQVDSRTILDEGGAEGLIGRGDMLFYPVGIPKPKRVQGCFVADEEVEEVVNFIKSTGAAEYDESIALEIERNATENESGSRGGNGSDGDGGSDDDPMFTKAIEVVIEAGQASTSMLQRRLGVGYARAGRLIDQLAERGIIGPFEGSKPRKVLMTRQQFLEMNMSRSLEPTEITSAPPVQTNLFTAEITSNYTEPEPETTVTYEPFPDDKPYLPPF
ncbi:MAG: DNA translocase FtsK, partial [Clostridia bacterium]|nr:DNA translocase FtsK [Clostridia bacterium]